MMEQERLFMNDQNESQSDSVISPKGIQYSNNIPLHHIKCSKKPRILEHSSKTKKEEDECENQYDLSLPRPESFFVMSFLVTVFFNLPLGALALFCSCKAMNSFERGEGKKGRCWARGAFYLSITGIVISSVTAMLVVFYLAYYDVSS